MLGPASVPAGTCFGPYEVVRELGAGGMGTVYEGRHRSLGKRVAIKTLHAPLATHPNVVARFVNEARAASRMSHPNVAEVYDVGVENGQPYLVMELLHGETLHELVEREGRLAPARALAILCPIAAALDAAHRDGIVHRDVKPENIFLARPRVGPPVPKLLDFGIAKLRQEGDSLTRDSDVFGTPYYMSPEQTRGAKYVDARSDQYSLGAVLYECVTGAHPFDAPHMVALIVRIQTEALVPPRTLVPELPEGLEAVMLRAMAREPDARFPSTAAFAAALLKYADAPTRAYWSASLDVDAALLDVPEPVTDVHDGEPQKQSGTARAAAVASMSGGPPSREHGGPRASPSASPGAIPAAVTPIAWSASRFGTAPPSDRMGRGLAIGGAAGGVVGALAGAIAMALVASSGPREVEPPHVVAPEPIETRGPANVGARVAAPEPLARPEPRAARAEPAPPLLVAPPVSLASGATDAGLAGAATDAGVVARAPEVVATRRVRARVPTASPARPAGGPSIGSNRAPILR